MAKLSEEKIPFKVFRIVCLVLIFVVLVVTIGVYFITKKSFNNTYDRYKEIVAQDISSYYKDSLFTKDGKVNVTYQKSPELALVAQNDSVPYYHLLNDQYLLLIKYSNTYFETYMKGLAKDNNSLNRAKMNDLYKKVDNLEEVVLKFEQDKAELEDITNTNDGSFKYDSQNNLIALNTHMQSYVSLISELLSINNTLSDLHVELNDVTLNLNAQNAKTMINFAIMYATNYIVINYFETMQDNNELFESFVDDEIFVLTQTLYDINEKDNKEDSSKRVPIEVSNNIANYNYLYNRTKNINVELDNLKKCAKEIKNNTQNAHYQSVLNAGRQDVLTFLQHTLTIIK